MRTYVTPFDPLIVREALLREHYRGGQSFYVVPRIADLGHALEFLKDTVPEVKAQVAHGQLASAQLEDTMTAFYDGKIDVLVSTNIVESGLDIPTANTLIVHRADMFGLAQLYQLRGRIGRSKQRAYAYLTTPPDRKLTEGAERRLQVLQSLDKSGRRILGGEPRSRHPRRRQSAGRRAIRPCARGRHRTLPGHAGGGGGALARGRDRRGARQLVAADQPRRGGADPGNLRADLNVRMALYRRLAEIESQGDIDGFAAELIDRFGNLPDEVENLLKIVAIKQLCRAAHGGKDRGRPEGRDAVTFRNKTFPNAAGLVRLITDHAGTMRVRPDQKVVVARDWPTPEARLKGPAPAGAVGETGRLALTPNLIMVHRRYHGGTRQAAGADAPQSPIGPGPSTISRPLRSHQN